MVFFIKVNRSSKLKGLGSSFNNQENSFYYLSTFIILESLRMLLCNSLSPLLISYLSCSSLSWLSIMHCRSKIFVFHHYFSSFKSLIPKFIEVKLFLLRGSCCQWRSFNFSLMSIIMKLEVNFLSIVCQSFTLINQISKLL